MTAMTEAEVLEKAKAAFGEDGVNHVTVSNGLWVIHLEAGEDEQEANLSEFEGTDAMDAYNEYEATYGSTLNRWMVKNGHYGSLAEGMRAYNAQIEKNAKEGIRMVRAAIEKGHAFDWAGAEQYRDAMLKLAEEKGW